MADTLEGLDPQLASIVQRIIAESGGTVWVESGFRTREEQEALYEKYQAGTGNLAAKPGTSAHEHGGAIDFGGDLTLAGQLARKYGLINSVPGEPWHWTLGGESGSGLDTRHEEYDLGGVADPGDVLANRLNSVLRILGQDGTQNTDYGTPTLNDDMRRSNVVGSEVRSQLTTDPRRSSSPKGQLQTYAIDKLRAEGMGDDDIDALIELWNRESGWDPNAQNPTSTAFGIAQFLNGTWAGTGYEKTTDPYKQIDAGLTYIRQRYGSPSRALDFHSQNGWY